MMQVTYRVEQEQSREAFGNYSYRIFKGSALVAHYWHDYRGDEHGIRFLNGMIDQWPVGRMTDFLQGGGPTPPILSARATAYMDERT
jgi:hypothetical protein